MKRPYAAGLMLLLACLVGLTVAQSSPAQPAFALERQIGQPRPTGIEYDPHFDRFAWVSPDGALRLIEGARYRTQHTLYERGLYNAYRFSHDGRYLALAIETRVEIWDTDSGQRLLDFAPDGALRVEGPLYFSPDDTLLAFNTQVRAPQALRRSENDTVNLPYLWDIAAEQGERSSVLPGARAIPFFDYRNGFVYGAGNTAIVGLAERIQILNIAESGVSVVAEISSNRFEPDPLLAWEGTSDTPLYLRPNNSNSLVQINTQTGDTLELPVGRDLSYTSIQQLEPLLFSDVTQIIGQDVVTTRTEIPLVRALLGFSYRRSVNFSPVTVYLLDVLQPLTEASGDRPAVLLYLFDEQRGTGRLEFLSPPSVRYLALHPQTNELALRRESGSQQIEIYDIASGLLQHVITPALTTSAEIPFGYRADGELLVSDFQRFDAATADLISEDLSFNSGFESFYIDDDNQTLNTVRGGNWWSWEIQTGELQHRTTFQFDEEQRGRSDDGERLLSYSGNGATILDIGRQAQSSVNFDRQIRVSAVEQVIPAPDWQHFLVIYSLNPYGQHAPGNELAVYSVEDGQTWYIAGSDLPANNERQYGWLDNLRFYVAGNGAPLIERVYGVEYADNGLPQCLVEAFPDDYTQWADFWEREQFLRDDEAFHSFAQAICDLLPADAQQVDAFLMPSPTPTRPPVTPTPAVIAGVPACLTERFPAEAQAYAQEWRELSEGLSPQETDELETLLCESLTGSESVPRSAGQPTASNVQVMTFDVNSGVRRVGEFIPADDLPDPPDLDVLREAFFEQYRVRPSDVKLSPDRQRLAVRSRGDYVLIYRLQRPYSELVADATATVQAQSPPTEEARSVSLRPLPTEGFSWQGQPRPTRTPTVTPTIPATPDMPPAWQSDYGNVVDVCPFERHFTLDDPPPDFAATGRIVGTVQDASLPGVMDAATGYLTLTDSLPQCASETVRCFYSFGDEWLLRLTDRMIIMRPDGSDRHVLFTDEQYPYLKFAGFEWLSGDVLQFSYEMNQPDERNPVMQVFRAAAANNFQPEPVTLPENSRYLELSTSFGPAQPGLEQRYVLASIGFRTGVSAGRRYYMHDRISDTHTYFAQIDDTETQSLSIEWHPLGEAFYYRLPDDDTWHVFDPETQQFYAQDTFYRGVWSPDSQRRVDWFTLPGDELNQRMENGETVPRLRIWNHATGEVKRYCFPGFDPQDAPLQEERLWSPDGRYLAFTYEMPLREDDIDGILDDVPQSQTYVLDTETGSVTQIGQGFEQVSIWTRSAGAYD